MPELEDNANALQTVLTADALAGRLANTVELMTIWASALNEDPEDSSLSQRLAQAAHQLDLAVEALTEATTELSLPVPANGEVAESTSGADSAQSGAEPAPSGVEAVKTKDPRSPFLRHESIITTANEGSLRPARLQRAGQPDRVRWLHRQPCTRMACCRSSPRPRTSFCSSSTAASCSPRETTHPACGCGSC